jgi:hypothetical protein
VGIVIIAIYLDRVTRPLGHTIWRKKPGVKVGALLKVSLGSKKVDVDPDTAGTTGAGAKVGTGGSA